MPTHHSTPNSNQDSVSFGVNADDIQTRPKPHIPEEIHAIILSHVRDRHTLSSYCLVSRSMNALAHKKLYQSVLITRYRTKDGHLPVAAKIDSVRNNNGRFFQNIPPAALEYTEYLTVHWHDYRWCQPTTTSVSLPQLAVLRLDLQRYGHLHLSQPNTCYHSCDFLNGLQPSKLVLWYAFASHRQYENKPHGILEELHNVDDLIFVCRLKRWSGVYWPTFRPRPLSWLPRPPGPRRLVWIFYTHTPHQVWSPNGPQLFNFAPIAKSVTKHPHSRILFVNAEHVNPLNVGPTVSSSFQNTKTFKDHLFSEISSIMRREGSDQKKFHERCESIDFLSMNEYLEREDWRGVFEYDEVSPWFRVE